MGTRTHIGLAAAALVLVAVCAWIIAARPFAGEDATSNPPPIAASGYTMGQYRQLREGMSAGEVDGIMGGGAIRTTSEIGGQTLDVFMYLNEDGSSVTASFLEGAMLSKAAGGF
jgi:hypothetical protein